MVVLLIRVHITFFGGGVCAGGSVGVFAPPAAPCVHRQTSARARERSDARTSVRCLLNVFACFFDVTTGTTHRIATAAQCGPKGGDEDQRDESFDCIFHLFSFVVVCCSCHVAPAENDHSANAMIDHGVKPYFSP